MKRIRRFSFGKKMFLYVVLVVLLIATGTAMISYFISAGQIDEYFKQNTLDNARNFASLIDTGFLEELRAVAVSDDFQAIRAKADEAVEAMEETEDDAKIAEAEEKYTEAETDIEEYLKGKGLWDKYVEQRELLHSYNENIEDIKYLYVIDCVDEDPSQDMYLLGDYEEEVNIGIYETGLYEDREEDLLAVDFSKEVEPTISNGEWGWLCSGFAPVRDSAGKVICNVGCDVGMDDVMKERWRFLMLITAVTFGFIIVVLVGAVLFSRKVVVKPLNMIREEMLKFKPVENAGYEEAGVANLDIRNRDEIGDIYNGVVDMQKNIVDYLNDISVMRTEKERRDAELNVATRMQADMLPKNFDTIDALSLYATMTPAKEMGGDFYDFFEIDDDHFGLVMADVSGKGMPAAMFMIAAKTLLKNRATAIDKPSDILYDVNNTLCAENPSGLFVTIWFAIITLSTGEMVSVNAGHEYPIIKRADGQYEYEKKDNDPPIATMEDTEYEDEVIQLNKGDRIFLYTDGVPEAKNHEGERFGIDRMLDVLNSNMNDNPETLIAKMKEVVDVFTTGDDPFDDITMMSVVWNGK